VLLQGKVVVVSGIGPGLGMQLAMEAAREGARAVVLAARSSHKLEEAADNVRRASAHTEVISVATDIRDPQQCSHLVEVALASLGCIDALANNAFEHGPFGSIEDGELGAWRSAYETNVLGSVQMTRAVAPQMRKQGGGAVVMVNTMATIKPFPGEAGYAASKGALLTATRYLAIELGPSNIRVNTIRPGWMWGPPVQAYVEHTARTRGVPQNKITDEVASRIALRRIVSDRECARAALFLLSDYASGVTGAVLDANGGEVTAG
jgi:NAD(P)-dependent dehydrogenase (short-subunit alcohol dehydrogenase family)